MLTAVTGPRVLFRDRDQAYPERRIVRAVDDEVGRSLVKRY
jgi:hypothetical protein